MWQSVKINYLVKIESKFIFIFTFFRIRFYRKDKQNVHIEYIWARTGDWCVRRIYTVAWQMTNIFWLSGKMKINKDHELKPFTFVSDMHRFKMYEENPSHKRLNNKWNEIPSFFLFLLQWITIRIKNNKRSPIHSKSHALHSLHLILCSLRSKYERALNSSESRK